MFTPTSPTAKTIVNSIKTNKAFLQNFLPKVSRSPSEKVHLSFLKWALGVHRKASNVGVWGETGRYPLINQSLRLTLNFFKRLQMLPDSSFAKAALKEQVQLKLPWFSYLEPITKLDEIFHLDHVNAHRIILNSKNVSNKPLCNKNINSLSGLRSANPLPSKKFRVEEVIKILTKKFV